MEKESLDQYRSVHIVLYSTQRQNSTVRKLFRLLAFPGEGAASALPVLYVHAPTSRVLNPNVRRADVPHACVCGVRAAHGKILENTRARLLCLWGWKGVTTSLPLSSRVDGDSVVGTTLRTWKSRRTNGRGEVVMNAATETFTKSNYRQFLPSRFAATPEPTEGYKVCY